MSSAAPPSKTIYNSNTSSSEVRENKEIKILLLGDEGVGKTSLLSTYISRHFSERVPGVMTQVRLPTSRTTTSSSKHVTTFIDTQYDTSTSSSTTTSPPPPAAAADNLASSGTHDGSIDSSSSTNKQLLADNMMMSSSASWVTSTEKIADAVILVYDLDRVGTFNRIEEYWLPLLAEVMKRRQKQQQSNLTTTTTTSKTGHTSSDAVIKTTVTPIPVILAGNKLDLTLNQGGGEEARAHRQQILSLMQKYKFVRQCIKCSAKTLLNVNQVFEKAQQAVLYPIGPLYDLEKGDITVNCRKALVRIFRMSDKDRDGLLSDQELEGFQLEFFKVPIFERQVVGWKKVLSKNNYVDGGNADDYIRDNKFTLDGFIKIVEMFMLKDLWEFPWTVLRVDGYDDDLNLTVPETVRHPPLHTNNSVIHYHHQVASKWMLSPAAVEFLMGMFHQFSSSSNKLLTENDMINIFSILPDSTLPPWHPSRGSMIFDGAFSKPKLSWGEYFYKDRHHTSTNLSDSVGDNDKGQLIISSGSDETVEDNNNNNNNNNNRGHDNNLGSAEVDNGGVGDVTTNNDIDGLPVNNNTDDNDNDNDTSHTNKHPPINLNEWLGYWHMTSALAPGNTREDLYRLGFKEPSSQMSPKHNYKAPQPVAFHVKVFGTTACGKTSFLNSLLGDCSSNELPLATVPTKSPESRFACVYMPRPKGKSRKDDTGVVYDVYHLILTEVPESFANYKEALDDEFELALFTFDSSNEESFKFVQQIEKQISDDVPRLFVGLKPESDSTNISSTSSSLNENKSVTIINKATIHCTDLELEPPLLVSSISIASNKDGSAAKNTLEYIAKCALGKMRSLPHAEKRRMALRKRKILYYGGISVGFIFAGTFVYQIFRGSNKEGVGGFFRKLFRFTGRNTHTARNI